MNHEEISKLTLEYGAEWGVNHSERLIRLVSIIGEGIEYNREAIWLTAYLHDWGAYQPWIKPGMQHYDRSEEVAREFLTERGCPMDLMELVLECIKCHHGGNPNRSIESRLFTDADALDLLGIVGAARIFAMNPRNLQAGFDALKRYRDMSIKAISLDKTHEIAKKRIEETEQFIRAFEEETFGIL